jgi:muconolactone delta-isomerase
MVNNIDESHLNKFLVTINFFMDEEFMTLVPSHRTYINFLINKGVIDSYAVSMESYRSWIMMTAETKDEIRDYLKKSPLFKYWTFEIDELFMYDGQTYRLPALQMN